jgi:SAM-dependent methyltransferase
LLQKHPFLNGNDPVFRKTVLDLAGHSIVIRNSYSDVEITRLNQQDVVWWTDEEERVKRTLKNKGLTDRLVDETWDDLAWKMRFVPPDAKRILSIGCGGGAELFFLRLRSPNATIQAVDWTDTLAPAFRDVAGVAFSVQNLTSMQDFPGRDFDVIFSSHVIEHMYAPDARISEIRKLLVPGGVFVSALPLDGQGNVAFKDSILKIARSRQKVGATDAFIIDFGHPWKTNFSDLNQTLHAAGVVDVDFFQREWCLTRNLTYSDEERQKKLAAAMFLHGAIIRPAQNAVKALFGLYPPFIITRAFQALERRISFGSDKIRHDCSMETAFVARNPA